jgi:hypothetical protein
MQASSQAGGPRSLAIGTARTGSGPPRSCFRCREGRLYTGGCWGWQARDFSCVGLAIDVYENLLARGVRARVVSMPSWEPFEQQSQQYRDTMIPPEVTVRISVEEGSTLVWALYHGSGGRPIGMRTFGTSAPVKALQKNSALHLIVCWERRESCGQPSINAPASWARFSSGRIRSSRGKCLLPLIDPKVA